MLSEVININSKVRKCHEQNVSLLENLYIQFRLVELVVTCLDNEMLVFITIDILIRNKGVCCGPYICS